MIHRPQSIHLCSYTPLFFFNDPATTEIYTLSLHDALPILTSSCSSHARISRSGSPRATFRRSASIFASSPAFRRVGSRSEEHTSELQSRQYLVCRLLLEKKHNRTPVTTLSHMPPSA